MTGDSRDDLTRRVGDPAVVQQVFDQLPVIAVALQGPELRYVAANSTARAFTGRERLLGLPLVEAVPEVVGQQSTDLFAEVMATGEPRSLRDWRAHLERPDGGGPVEVFVDFTVVPWRDGDGALVGVVVTVADVTQRMRERQAAQARAAAAERRFAQARDVIDALQRELLPSGVPVVPGLEIAASYLLADADTAAGGDWFDAIPLRDGRVALVVGDVVGHGVRASAVMGQLRVLLTDYLAETGDIALALEAVDRHAERVRDARSATVCVVVVDPDAGQLSYCTAGHPPPLVVPASGEPRYLFATGSGPLATSGEFVIGHDELAPGDLVLLYSDGVLERPGRDLRGASVELAQVATDIAAGRALRSTDPTVVERVATQSLEMLTRTTGHTDDITLLAAQRVAPSGDFAVRADASPAAVAAIRAALARWLDGAHVGADDARAVQHAVGELVTNAVEHAYQAADPGPVAVAAALSRGGEIRIQVSDEGRWREPVASTGRGRGLWMVQQLVDELVVEHPGGATVAFVRRRLSRPARLLTTDTLTAPPATASAATNGTLIVEDGGAGRLRVAGPVDSATASRVATALAHASTAGTRALTVDLAGVTHLASAGVSLLHDADLRSLANGTQLRLYAPAGSPADQILTLVALPHTTVDGDAHDDAR